LTPIFDGVKKKRYLEYLKKEIREYFQCFPLSGNNHTLYFGGGTPSVLSPAELSSILSEFPLFPEGFSEVTLEANPEDMTYEYVQKILEV
jgi:oxygen-independent coproporphyrinogen-3 oxidase